PRRWRPDGTVSGARPVCPVEPASWLSAGATAPGARGARPSAHRTRAPRTTTLPRRAPERGRRRRARNPAAGRAPAGLAAAPRPAATTPPGSATDRSAPAPGTAAPPRSPLREALLELADLGQADEVHELVESDQ